LYVRCPSLLFWRCILRFLRLLVFLQLASLDGSTVALEQHLSDPVFCCLAQTQHCGGPSLPCIAGKKIGVLARLKQVAVHDEERREGTVEAAAR
jgi:hypothetical protein